MADQANIFDNGNPTENPAPQEPQPTAVPTQPQAPVLAPEVAALVGEGRKYANVEAALASVPHAQQHIASLESENQTLKQQVADLQGKLEKAASLEDVVASLTANQNPNESQVPAGLDEQGVLKLLEQREAQRLAQANQVQVTNALITQFGDATKATEALQAKAAEFGVDFDYMKELAAKSPTAVLSYFNVQSKPNTVETPHNPVPAQFQTPPEPTYSYVPQSGSTSDLIAAFRECGKAVNGGEEIKHSI